MIKGFFVTCIGFLLFYSGSLIAGLVTVPVPIDYRLIQNIVIKQLYTGNNTTAHLWKDRGGCSLLDLSDPKIDGQQGLVRIVNNVHARFGTGMGGQCMTLIEWTGKLETFQRPVLDEGGSVLSFPIVKAVAYDPGGHALKIDQLQDLIKRVAEPKLAAVKIDLQEARGDIEKTLAKFTPSQNNAAMQTMLDSLRFREVKAGDAGLGVKLSFEAPSNAVTEKKPVAPFSESEMQQWQASWQSWDAFLSEAIDQAAADTQSEEIRDTLLEILLEARAAFQSGLTSDNRAAADPVRMFFNTTWDRLAPVLRTIANEVPGAGGLRYLTFIAATDVLYELEAIGAPLGLEISSDGLRRLGRLLMAKQTKS